jgi:hypothetical protein
MKKTSNFGPDELHQLSKTISSTNHFVLYASPTFISEYMENKYISNPLILKIKILFFTPTFKARDISFTAAYSAVVSISTTILRT